VSVGRVGDSSYERSSTGSPGAAAASGRAVTIGPDRVSSMVSKLLVWILAGAAASPGRGHPHHLTQRTDSGRWLKCSSALFTDQAAERPSGQPAGLSTSHWATGCRDRSRLSAVPELVVRKPKLRRPGRGHIVLGVCPGANLSLIQNHRSLVCSETFRGTWSDLRKHQRTPRRTSSTASGGGTNPVIFPPQYSPHRPTAGLDGARTPTAGI
jgi:hypothetical protein